MEEGVTECERARHNNGAPVISEKRFLTPEYPEISSKYLNLAIRLLAAELSSDAPLSAFLSFLSFDFFSLKFMLWGTYAEQNSAVKTDFIRAALPLVHVCLKSLKSYFFEAHFQVVLRLLLIIWKRFINQKLLFHVDLKQTNKKKP